MKMYTFVAKKREMTWKKWLINIWHCSKLKLKSLSNYCQRDHRCAAWFRRPFEGVEIWDLGLTDPASGKIFFKFQNMTDDFWNIIENLNWKNNRILCNFNCTGNSSTKWNRIACKKMLCDDVSVKETFTSSLPKSGDRRPWERFFLAAPRKSPFSAPRGSLKQPGVCARDDVAWLWDTPREFFQPRIGYLPG